MEYQIAGGPMFFNDMTFLVIFVIGMILMIIGFGFRDRNLGIVLLGVSFLAVLAVSIKKAIDLFS